LVDPNDTREPCPGRKGVELASEIRHAADASRCVHPAAEYPGSPSRAFPLLGHSRTLAHAEAPYTHPVQPASKLLTASAVVLVALVAAFAAGCGSGTKRSHVAAKSDPPLLELTGRVGDITLGEPKMKVENEYGTEGDGFHVTYRNAGAISGYYRLHHGRV
jgi:hypothetical protein